MRFYSRLLYYLYIAKPMKKKILFICLGNICRSPAAEGILKKLIKAEGLQKLYQVDSAGTGGWHAGQPADRRMCHAASKRGLKIDSISRQINIDDFTKYDYILTMDNDNLSAVKKLAGGIPVYPELVIKPILSYSSSSEYIEVPDPYYGGESGFDEVLDLLEDACKGLLRELTKT